MNNSTCLYLLVAAISGLASAGAAELQITQDIVPPATCGRPLHRPMRPTFITIHSTDNTSRSADAWHHAQAMKKGLKGRHNRTGYLTWHFTVDDHSIYQSLPTNETGEHADYEGPGNRTSIGIEMCVNRGSDLGATIDRTAQLTARLMHQYDIPLDHVVPHMNWRMIRYSDHRDLGYKKCPKILLDRGRLGAKWSAFLAKSLILCAMKSDLPSPPNSQMWGGEEWQQTLNAQLRGENCSRLARRLNVSQFTFQHQPDSRKILPSFA